jgi:hypothetical protein
MKTMFPKALNGRRALRLAAACAALPLASCGLDEVNIPELGGPSERGIAIKITASPDVVTADGFSTSLVTVQVFDQNGGAAPNRTVLLALADAAGRFADLGTLYSPAGARLRAAEATVVTNSSGLATAVYTAPARTDFTADDSVVIGARLVGTDFNGATYNYVRVELKSAEPRLFPQNPGNDPPLCSFVVEAPQGSTVCSGPTTCGVRANTSVLFQSTSSDPDGVIVRYDWYWGDGTPNNDSPDTNHVFRTVGDFEVIHRVTDNNGAAVACTGTITVVP